MIPWLVHSVLISYLIVGGFGAVFAAKIAPEAGLLVHLTVGITWPLMLVWLINREGKKAQLRYIVEGYDKKKKKGTLSSSDSKGDAKPVCAICADTHEIRKPAKSMWIVSPCRQCPLPCSKCASRDGKGPYCENAHCDCKCHIRF